MTIRFYLRSGKPISLARVQAAKQSDADARRTGKYASNLTLQRKFATGGKNRIYDFNRVLQLVGGFYLSTESKTANKIV